ncbi:small ubiquitin-related modifier [Lactarius pseudohatsudake]|nr:small ubiquitin-related modifier [Lactarius pseudohatsudake]
MSQGPQIKPEVVDNNNDINVKFVSAVGYGSDRVYFKARRTTRFSILQDAFAIIIKKDVNNFRFSYDGTQINGHDTPGSLDMEDNGIIDVMILQISG